MIVTPEGLPLELTLASRGARFGALIIDLILMLVTLVGSLMILSRIAGGAWTAPHDKGTSAVQFLYVVWTIAAFLLHNGWFLFFELGPRGATPGKRMLGIRIAARDGARLTAEMVVARNLLRDVELFLPLLFIVQSAAASAEGEDMLGPYAGLGWILILALFPLFNRDRLRAGDLIAGSWVVEAPRRRLEPPMSAPAALSPVHAYHFGEAELATYGEHELKTLERVLREHRPEVETRVAEAICARIGWSAPGEAAAHAFLEAYYTQLRARLEGRMRFGKRKADKHAAEA
jgi:uncharacterized RDD family membrane protein YckC